MLITRRTLTFAGAAALADAHLPVYAAEPIQFDTLRAMGFIVPLLARDEGLFKKRGLNVNIEIATQAPTLLPAVEGGSLQFGVSTGAQVAMADAAGLDIVIVAGAGVITKNDIDTAIVVRPNSMIKTPHDLIGKKVMAPGINGSYYILFLRYLKNGGVDPRQVDIVEGGFAQMPEVLRAGQVDAVLAAEPFLTRMIETGVGKRLNYFIPDHDYYIMSFFIAKRSWVDLHKDDLINVLAALREAVVRSKSDPVATISIARKYLKLPPNVMAKQRLPDWRIDVKPEDVQFWADMALQFGLLKKPVDAKTLLV